MRHQFSPIIRITAYLELVMLISEYVHGRQMWNDIFVVNDAITGRLHENALLFLRYLDFVVLNSPFLNYKYYLWTASDQ